ncbi:hypothetical protein B7494_g3461 [Chlorociboria aeruginascens]|nr:hypothetical protein B7494_g3461 [Chlorociboria aeruginascens]
MRFITLVLAPAAFVTSVQACAMMTLTVNSTDFTVMSGNIIDGSDYSEVCDPVYDGRKPNDKTTPYYFHGTTDFYDYSATVDVVNMCMTYWNNVITNVWDVTIRPSGDDSRITYQSTNC